MHRAHVMPAGSIATPLRHIAALLCFHGRMTERGAVVRAIAVPVADALALEIVRVEQVGKDLPRVRSVWPARATGSHNVESALH